MFHNLNRIRYYWGCYAPSGESHLDFVVLLRGSPLYGVMYPLVATGGCQGRILEKISFVSGGIASAM